MTFSVDLPAGGSVNAESQRRARQALEEAAEVHRAVADGLADAVVTAADVAAETLTSGGKLLLFGNGGSAADAQHLAAELVVRFRNDRPALAALALTTDSSVLTAVANDIGTEAIFTRQLEALGRAGDLAIAISTSGASANVLAGAATARRLGMRTIALTSEAGTELARECELAISVPAADTARIQEAHITIGHVLCELIEAAVAAH